MEEILKLLGIESLNESQQEEIKTKLNDLIDIKVNEKIEEKLEEEKASLVEFYEDKFEEYKEDITSKFSNFLDDVLNEELEIPENIMEFARKGEIYEEAINLLKTKIAVDEGILDEEAKSLLQEAKDEIVSLRDEVNTLYSEKLQLESDAKELATHLYLRKKCDGLTEAQKTKVMKLLEGVTSKEEIDRKFKVILESIKLNEQEEETFTCVCPECGKTEESTEACSMVECEECGVKMKEKENDKGVSEVKTKEKDTLTEEKSPWQIAVKSWAKILEGSN
jgi:ribosomal protein L37AE/L43A